MEYNETAKDSLKKELDAIGADAILSPAYQRKKLIQWVIRNSLSIVLYILFWKYEWVRWSLWVTIPLSLLSLLTILIVPTILKRKLERTKRKIDDAQRLIDDTLEE